MSKQRLVVRRIPEVGCAVYDQDTGEKVSPPGDAWWPNMRRARQAIDALVRRYEGYAAKFIAETVGAEPLRYVEPTDDNLTSTFAGCTRVPPAGEYPEIREAIERLLTKREARRVARGFTRYSHEQRANLAASHRAGHRQKQAVGEHYYTHPDVSGRAFPTRTAAAEAGVRAQRPGELLDRDGQRITVGDRVQEFTNGQIGPGPAGELVGTFTVVAIDPAAGVLFTDRHVEHGQDQAVTFPADVRRLPEQVDEPDPWGPVLAAMNL